MAIPDLLKERELTTEAIEVLLKSRLPECIDEEKCMHGGIVYGVEWKHLVRGALDDLNKEGVIDKEHLSKGKPWRLRN